MASFRPGRTRQRGRAWIAAGASADDLKLIEGIGPKIAGILQAAGIRSFARLAAMTPAAIQPLDSAGPNYRIADPLTWPEQAGHAVAGRWGALKALQHTLIGGRRVVVRSPARTAMNPSTTSTDAWQMFRRVDWTLAAGMALALLAVLGLGPGGRNWQAAASAALQPALVMPADRAPQRLS